MGPVLAGAVVVAVVVAVGVAEGVAVERGAAPWSSIRRRRREPG